MLFFPHVITFQINSTFHFLFDNSYDRELKLLDILHAAGLAEPTQCGVCSMSDIFPKTFHWQTDLLCMAPPSEGFG